MTESSDSHNTDTLTKRKNRVRKSGIVTTEDDEMEPLPSQPNGADMLKDQISLLGILISKGENYLIGLDARWRNMLIRGIFAFFMIAIFTTVISMGGFAVSLLVILIQIKCFQEIIDIGYFVYKSDNLPGFRTLSWFFLFASNYSLYGQSLIHHFGFLTSRNHFLQTLIVYHRMISFLLYTAGFVGFVWSLKKTYYLKQFTLFGYTHITLMILVTSSNQMTLNVFEGMIWFLFPVAVINCNDIMAYVFGFLFGRTPLTKLSPKKTWEGFIGGGISTLIFGFILAGILSRYEFFVCPIQFDTTIMSLSTNCTPSALFQKTMFYLPKPFSIFKETLHLYPFQLHSIILSLFASIIGPFGGFFASGFKRAFRLKDFAATIPGHGGFVDRFDCQILMAMFTNVYLSIFAQVSSPHYLFQQVLALTPENREKFLQLVQHYLNE